MSEGKSKFLSKVLVVSAGLGLLYIISRNRRKIFSIFNKHGHPLYGQRIELVDSVEKCDAVVADLKKQCIKNPVLGFDCEWITVNGKRRPVALLQLATDNGLCALFRLCHLRPIPVCLRELLLNDRILKVGVDSHEDAKKLAFDYSLCVSGTYDLRFLAKENGYKAEGLAKLAKSHLNVVLDKNWRLSCSNWEAVELTSAQLNYAANDALVAVKIFNKLFSQLKKTWYERTDYMAIHQLLEYQIDTRFNAKLENRRKCSPITDTAEKGNQIKRKTYTGIRASNLYDNTQLQAPDGELLGVIDYKKAKWYIDNGLAIEIATNPYIARLNFEPAARPVGSVGQYYKISKDNQCVVCGKTDTFVRKNVVPREYRKHFPDVMKSHSSHDVLLLCPQCHEKSNISDLAIRTYLANLCDAPISHNNTAIKSFEIPKLKSVKSAGRAILNHSEKLPEARKNELLEVLKNYFSCDNIDEDQLLIASELNTNLDNPDYCQHGEKVVEKYCNELGGLVTLEKLWREHFLKTMEPRYLPELWDVNHNANRLEIRAQEGRLNEIDMLKAGIKNSSSNEKNH
ncbi:exonuclease 3'-5' domain-containing protein 2 isoform X1 [Teleopsis dalmanni]|uniref:exonuclease 3'-5' domain-containing protein 2 isoform X1 n=1 Tax=Teleopsis dalmanni TaxID=139649 RepID=UPI0018CF5FEA|nr:exonuclease 3'-5' domain-containing protein 2 isoform X1 [Teleopsis dalmanni]